MPPLWEGKRWSNGKPNPVTLVATVVARKTPVHPLNRFPASIPKRTTKPERIPIRLMTTWIKVKVCITFSDLRRSAIHEQFDAVDEAAVVRSEKHDGLGDFVGRAGTAQRRRGGGLGLELLK